jgi:sugar lactone lactonase YvrE
VIFLFRFKQIRRWFRVVLPIVLVGIWAFGALAYAQESSYLETIAGSGLSPYRSAVGPRGEPLLFLANHPPGDNGPATQAFLNNPTGIAEDSKGNLYIADSGNNRIRKIDCEGIITTIAGTGVAQFGGDGGLAKRAELNYPHAIAIASDDSLYIADTFNHRIRKVSIDGIITTVVGGGEVFGPHRNAASALSVRLRYPEGVAIGTQGQIFIADTQAHQVHRVNSNGQVETLMGEGEGFPLNGPSSITVDVRGAVYVADWLNWRVVTNSGSAQRCNLSLSGRVCLYAGNGISGSSGDGGPAAEAQLGGAKGVFIDAGQNLYIADTFGSGTIRKVDAQGIISTIAGSRGDFVSAADGYARDVRLSLPYGVFVSRDGTVYIADSGNGKIRRLAAGPPALAVDATSEAWKILVLALLIICIVTIRLENDVIGE